MLPKFYILIFSLIQGFGQSDNFLSIFHEKHETPCIQSRRPLGPPSSLPDQHVLFSQLPAVLCYIYRAAVLCLVAPWKPLEPTTCVSMSISSTTTRTYSLCFSANILLVTKGPNCKAYLWACLA